MATVIGVRFRNAGKLYYFDPEKLWPTAGDGVIVETARGQEFGEVVTGVKEVADESITPPLRRVVRVATPEDVKHHQENEQREKEALSVCQSKVEEHKLQMKLVGCEYTFDNSKLLFYFTSDKRVDFRLLVKDLAGIFRTRIELRQIGVRDEAKMMGGLGLCGRPVCCAQFLGDFQPVSIKMAKEQSLSLNPTKISGVCGRLMCCLKFEEDHYEETRKRMPKLGKDVETPDGFGTVIDMNVLKETLTVRVRKGDTSEVKTYPLADVRWFKPPVPVARPRAEERADADRRPMKPVKEAPAQKTNETDEPTASVADQPSELVASYEPLQEELEMPEETDSPWKKAVEEALKQSK